MARNGNLQAGTPRRPADAGLANIENYPFLRLVLPLAIGIAAGSAGHTFFAASAPVLLALLAVAAAALAVMAFSRRYAVERLWFGLTANAFFFLLGALSYVRSADASECLWPGEAVVCEGIVSDRPVLHDKVVRARVRLSGYYRGEAYFVSERTVQLTALRSPAADGLATGAGVMFLARVTSPRNAGNPYETDFASYLRRSGVTGTAFAFSNGVKQLSRVRTRDIINVRLSWWEHTCLRARIFRDGLQTRYERSGIVGDNLAVLSAMTLGSRHLLTRSARQLFADTGVSHVLALSGLHLGILFGIFQFLFTAGGFVRRARVPAQVAVMLAVWAYVVMAGLPSSLVRAAVMYSLVSLGIIIGRTAITLNNLYIAAFVMLLVQPAMLFDVGFQLSFLSVFFILVFAARLTPKRVRHIPVVGKLWGMAAVSISAQMGVAPLVAYYFNSFPTYFIVSNFVAVPMAFLLVTGGLLYLALSWFAPAAWLVGGALDFLLGVMMQALRFIGGLPSASIAVFPAAATVALIYAAAFFAARGFLRRNRLVLALGAACVLAAVVVETATNARERDVAGVYFYKSLSCPAVHFVASADETYVYAPARYDDGAVRRALSGVAHNFWRRCDIAEPRRVTPQFSSLRVERNGCMMQLGRLRLCVLDTVYSRRAVPDNASADAIYVVRGFKGDAAAWMRRVRTKRVVLGENMSDYYRDEFIRQCHAAGVECYDLSVGDALKLPAR